MKTEKIGASMACFFLKHSARFTALTLALMLGQSAFADSDPMTTDPLKVGYHRFVLHKLFPFGEEDEAYTAQAHGNLSKADLEKLLQGSSDDYFQDMDYGITQPQNQDKLASVIASVIPKIPKDKAASRVVRGRNNWLVWTAGNDRFWNYMTRATFGGLDFLKTISNADQVPTKRSGRWLDLGLVNEPCFEQPTSSDDEHWGLWLDKRSGDCPKDPFADETRYPGIKVGARGQTLMYKGQPRTLKVGSFYGEPTGIIGLRLFTNPDFDQKAADNWNPERFYGDPEYYNNPNLVRPYRVGMACAFCHVGPNPTRPPEDFAKPKWENLSSNPGAQYFWVDRIFSWDWKKPDNFINQLLRTSRPGTLDTSLISSDMINNPRTMNAIYDLPARLELAAKMNHREKLTGNESLNAQFSTLDPSVVPADATLLRGLYNANNNTVLSPRVLKDGSDSVGALGALNRVYVNIGLFSEEWIQNFIPLVGGKFITPFRIDVARQKSLYWQATESQTPDLALFFVAASRPDKLANAPEGATFLKDLASPDLTLGKTMFAQNCAQCHSSKLPQAAYRFFAKTAGDPSCMGKNYLKCWDAYWKYAQTPEFKDSMLKLVMQPDFLKHNFLSNDVRVPVNILDVQLCSPVATNAIKDNIWDNFSSTSYKELPSVGQFTVNYPLSSDNTLTSESVTVPDGGRGFLRPASLISLWSTAPFLINNSVGIFEPHGTVQGRMLSFNDSINKMLNPDLRGDNTAPGHAPNPGRKTVKYTTSFGDQLTGIMDVTTADSFLKIPRGYLPDAIFNDIQDILSSSPSAAKEMWIKGTMYAQIPARDQKKPTVAKEEAPKKNWFQRLFSSNKTVKTEAKRNPADDGSQGMTANPADADVGEFLRLGPIPSGVPMNLITNIDMDANLIDLGEAIKDLVKTVIEIRSGHLVGKAASDLFMAKAAPALLKVSKCKDFVVNRGHYFGTQYSQENKKLGKKGMSDTEKAALIEFLKYM